MAAGITRVVSAIEDPNALAGRGHALLRASGIVVDVGVGATEARRAHAGHIRNVSDRRPHVSLKLAVSADGKVALAGRKPAPITGEAARARVHLMRAMNDAILIGIGTALADDPQLTCRLPGMASRSPVRVVLDADLRLPVASALVRSARETPLWVIAGETAPTEVEAVLAARGVEVFRLPATGRRIDSALRVLAGRGITRLMVEGGPTVAAPLVAADLGDDARLVARPRPIRGAGVHAARSP